MLNTTLHNISIYTFLLNPPTGPIQSLCFNICLLLCVVPSGSFFKKPFRLASPSGNSFQLLSTIFKCFQVFSTIFKKFQRFSTVSTVLHGFQQFFSLPFAPGLVAKTLKTHQTNHTGEYFACSQCDNFISHAI